MPPFPNAGERRPGGRLAAWLFFFGIAVYAATRFYRLTDFPIFFFTDEAIQANVAQSLSQHGFRDEQRVFLPPYFLNDRRWAMSLNIYLLVLPLFLFGKTVFVTRALFAFVSLMGAAAAAGALKVMKSPAWWSPPFILAAMPLDFLHARVAFETTPGCFAGLIFAYLLYRLRSPKFVYLVILMAGATFYSYTAGQGIVLVLGLLLAIIDLRYHVESFRGNFPAFAAAVLLAVLVAFPFVREMRRHPNSTREQLVVLHSHWITPTPLLSKIGTAATTYASAFHPRVWFRPNEIEMLRHRMKGMAYFPPALIPFLLLGIFASLRDWRTSPGHRVILLSPLAVPFSAAADRLQILRVLPMSIPVALLSALGFAEVLRWIRWRAAARAACLAAAVALTAWTGWMTREALVHGPTWYTEYGLYGMQYGAPSVLHAIRETLQANPGTRVHLSSTWANNPLPFLDFFLPGPERKRAAMGDIEGHLINRQIVTHDDLWVVTALEYDRALHSGKLVIDPPERVIDYPDGKPGFCFIRFRYSDDADKIFREEREARRRLVEGTVTIDGQRVVVRHSVLDMGEAEMLFDGREDDTVRGMESNPLVFEFEFPKPRRISRARITIGAMECEILFRLTRAPGGETVETRLKIPHPPGDTVQELEIPGGPVSASKARIEIRDLFAGDLAHVELRELSFH